MTRTPRKEQPAMPYAAIDLHVRRREVLIVDDAGGVLLARRIDTQREQFARIFANRAPMRILLESCTHSEWVAQCLEGYGHDVIVADPNYAPMYEARVRKIKTDRRDVAALARACRLGIYRRAHRVSAVQRDRRRALRVRRQLVQMRGRAVQLIGAYLRQEGLRLPRGNAETTLDRLARVSMPAPLSIVLQPLRTVLETLAATITHADAEIATIAREDAVIKRLMTAPGVGPIVATTFHAVLDTPNRFGGDVRRATAFLGLVPREYSSGERRFKGRITKGGPTELRSLLVQASWTIWRSRSGIASGLRAWAHAVAARRGRQVAVVALARRLTRILVAMWRDETDFQWTPTTA
jgi:transposase